MLDLESDLVQYIRLIMIVIDIKSTSVMNHMDMDVNLLYYATVYFGE